MNEFRLNRRYLPLLPYDPVTKTGGVPPSVRYIIVSGGRGSGKSTAVSYALKEHTKEDGYNILVTRYTMVAAHISIIPDFTDKIEADGEEAMFATTLSEVKNTVTGATIYFRGIVQSSKNQTARLKSIPDVKIFVLDEAEELTDENQFDTIDLSIRTTGSRNLVELVWNPTDINHWIYRRFFEERGIPYDFNGIAGDTCYIHTTYLNNLSNLSESFLAQAERMKAEDPDKYANVFLGKPRTYSEGVIFRNWVKAKEAPESPECWYGVDWGFSNDETAVVRCSYDSDNGVVWVREVLYRKGLLIGQIADAIRADMEKAGCPGTIVYCDPARPEHIAELRRTFGIAAVPANNRDKAGRVDWLRGCDIHFVGENIEAERANYRYMTLPNDSTRFTNVPQDGNDHLMDAINYGVVTHLRRQGIPNRLGEV